MFMYIARDDSILGTMRFVSRPADTQIYGAILPRAMTNQALLDYVAYKTYYEFAFGAAPLKPRKVQKKSDSAISSEDTPSKKKSAKAKKVAITKPKLTKKKASVKADKGKGLNVLSEVALSEADQLKERKGVMGDSGKEDDDDENDSNNDGDNDDGDDNDDDGDNDVNDDDKDEEYVDERMHTPPDYQLSDEEKVDDEEKVADKDDDEITKELYNDVNVNLGNTDVDITDDDQGGVDQQNVSQELGFEQVEEDAHVTITPVLDAQKNDDPMQSSSVSSDFTSKLLNLYNTPPRLDETSSQTSSLFTVPVTAIPEITSAIIVPPPPLFFNPLPQQATSTPTSTAFEATISTPALPDFAFLFKFKERVTHLEKDLSEMKQVDQYAKALASIPAIMDCYIDNKLGEAINKAIQAHKLDYRQEAQDEKNKYIGLVDTSMRTIIKEEVKTQLPQFLPQAVSDFAAPVIEKNVAESLEAVVLTKGVETTKTKIKTPLLDQTEGRKEGSQARKLSHPEIQGQSQVARAKEPTTSFDELMNTPIDFSAFVLNRQHHRSDSRHSGRTGIQPNEGHLQESYRGGDLSRRYSTSVTKTKAATYEIKRIKDLVRGLWVPEKILKKYDYGHLEEIEVRRDDQELYKFREGDFS
ncbi:hypothetical protein Tco_1388392 [Tanacetum coccineum]